MTPPIHSEGSAPEVVGQIVLIPVAEIVVGERARPVDPIWADALGRIMSVEGQKTPIEVCRLPGKTHWLLVAGAHRLAGAKSADMAYLRAIVVDNDAIERRMREISENLWRRELDPIDRATFIAQMHDLLRTRAGIASDASPQAIAAQARWQKALKKEADNASAIVADAYGWTDDIAQQLGLSKRTIEYDLLLHRRLSPADLNKLRDAQHPVLRNATQLRALAKLDAAERGEVIGLLTHGTAKAVPEALGILRQKPKPDPETKRLSAFLGSFHRMGVSEKKGALHRLVHDMTPAMRNQLREILDGGTGEA